MKKILSFLHTMFVPKETNNFKAKLLHINTLTVYLGFVILAGVLFGGMNRSSGSVLGFATDITTDKLFQLTNEKRAENGLSQLSYNDKLAAAAAAKAQHMFANNYWAHYAPDGTSPWNFILGAGYQYSYAGENLAKNFSFSNDVVEAWMNSPSHRENMLRPQYTDVGYAIANGTLNGEETTLVVQMFGTPYGGSTASDTGSAKPQQQSALPTLAPTAVPQIPIISVQPNPQAAVLAKQTVKPKINLFPAYLNINLFFLGFFLVALLTDFYLASKFRIVRVSGKNLAHFIFLAFILAGLFIITKGVIQ